MTSRSRRPRAGLLAGVVTLVLVLAAGAAYALFVPPRWNAETVLVILPSDELDAAQEATYYETLSQGQIVGTFAEVAANPTVRQQAANDLGLGPEESEDIEVVVAPIPNTSTIRLVATASSAARAEEVADTAAEVAIERFGDLAQPYDVSVVNPAEFSAFRQAPTGPVVLGISAIVGLALAVAVQQAVQRSAERRRDAVGADPDRRPAHATTPDRERLQT